MRRDVSDGDETCSHARDGRERAQRRNRDLSRGEEGVEREVRGGLHLETSSNEVVGGKGKKEAS